MTRFVEYIPRVAVEVTKVPQPLYVEAIRFAVREFCKHSNAWKETLDPLTVTADNRDIEVEHPDDARIIKILAAEFEGETLEAKPILWFDVHFPRWRTEESGDPLYFALITDERLALVPHPDAEGELLMEAVLMPSVDANDAPDFLYDRHVHTIAKGAKAYLMEMAGMPWTNPARAMQLQAQFINEADSANIAQAIGYSRARLRAGFQNR